MTTRLQIAAAHARSAMCDSNPTEIEAAGSPQTRCHLL
jgi:hypothetical protein